ncbi:hypothetical protein GW17_00038804 [Ensete ventricosum]|nr:hypothetical protein GW17_00038804 [Ensete ventricosum]
MMLTSLSNPQLLTSLILPFDRRHPVLHRSPSITAFDGGGGGGGSRDGDRFRALSLKRSGFLSVVDRAMEEEEEYRKARAEVQRKGVDVEGYLIEGISVGGHETCVLVPSLNVAFDIGRCPSKAVHQDFLFITHAHLDHIVSSLALFCKKCKYYAHPTKIGF